MMRRFFKVLLGDFARRIEIPQGFLCHIPEERRRTNTAAPASAKVVLKNVDGKTWPVELEEIDARVFLTTGWPKFVEDNCLGKGEFLVFKSDGSMQFAVLVFGVNAVEKSVWSSGSGARATGELDGKLPCDIFPSSKMGLSGDKSIEMSKSFTHSHSQVETNTLQNTRGDGNISSHDELETYLSLKLPMEDVKAKALAEVMRMSNLDKLTVELFCATLSLYKWNVDAAAEDFDICRGKPQIPELSIKQKLVSQFNFVKEQLRHFFPPDDSSSASIHERRKNDPEGPNLSNQPLHCDLTLVKHKVVDKHESYDLSHQQKKRRLGKLQQGSRRSLRLAHLKNTCNSTNNILKERHQAPEPSPALEDQVKERPNKSCLLHKKQDSVLRGVCGETIDSLSQDFRKDEPTRDEVGLSEVHGRNEGGIRKQMDQSNDRGNSKEPTKRNYLEFSQSFMGTGCETESLPANSELTSYSRITGLSFTWKASQYGNSLEKILLDIERDNFMNTIARVQKIIRDDISHVQTADVIEAIVRLWILKWDSCLKDSNAQRIVNALLEHAKKVKEQQNFNIEVRKEEFSAKVQDFSKWQLKELETGYTSLELNYRKATVDASICFLTLEEHKKKLHAIQDSQRTMMTKDGELQKLRHQVSEHETLYQKSVMEIVKVKMAQKSYQQTLDEVKRRLASTGPGSIDVEALVKAEMDNMSKELELSKGRLLNINFKKE